MIVTTTPSVEGYRITGYYGIVFGEVITEMCIRDRLMAILRQRYGLYPHYLERLQHRHYEYNRTYRALPRLHDAGKPVSYTHLIADRPSIRILS